MLSDNVYLYINKVVITPLVMKDDTIGISTCGYRFRKIKNFMNIGANVMGLPYGKDKSEKIHIGKRHKNPNLCKKGKVDA